jgi:hypothetical protein
VFVTTANASQAGRLLGTLERLEVDAMSWEPAAFYPTARGRRNERLRPQLADLLPIADRIRRRSLFHRDVWADLAGHTEAAWRRRALAGDWPTWKRPAPWFGPGPLPELAELATRYGDQTGQGVHFSADSVRNLWLDRVRVRT